MHVRVFRGRSVAVDKDIVDQAPTVSRSTRAWNQVVVDATFRYDTRRNPTQPTEYLQPNPKYVKGYFDPTQPSFNQHTWQKGTD